MMKLFVREQMPLFILVVLQLGVVTAVFYLDGYRNWKVAAYAATLGLCLLAAYVVYRYTSHRHFYKLLDRKDAAMMDSLISGESAPLPSALGELLLLQFKEYDQMRVEAERNRMRHVTFMNRWVHQMKTPLSVLELLLQEEEDERSASMREETDQLRRGLDMVLYMARLETFEQDFRVEEVKLRELTNEIILQQKRLFIRGGVFPEMMAGDELVVFTDRKWLAFILEQLFSNAVKYGVKGSGGKITVAVFPDKKGTVLELRDQGIGIPKADMKRIFQPYFTGENGRKNKESTGMGLYLVKTVMERMNHRIEAESIEGEGTVIRLMFLSTL